MRSWPTLVEPVNVTFLSRLSAMMWDETGPDEEVVSTFSTPSGRPASRNAFASASVVRGVDDAGLMITGQPAAKAGPIFLAPIASGKFHGVMAKTGPTGCFIVSSREPPAGAAEYRPATRTASSENQRRYAAP